MSPPREITLREGSRKPEQMCLLLLEDDQRFAELVRHVLADAAPEFEVEHVTRLSTAMARLVRQPISLIITDLDLPDSRGPATVRHLQRAAPNVPVVVLSGEADVEVALECIRDGADDFLVKGTLGYQALGRLVRLALERRRRMSAGGRSAPGEPEEEGDRTTLESIGLHLLRVADRTGLCVSLLFLKIDRPAGLEGTPAGTEAIASVLRRTLRRCDLVARLEADEWSVVLVMQQDDTLRAATRMAEAIIATGAGSHVQLGVAIYHPAAPETIDELIAQARRDLHAVYT
jgi:PleD family two-component response regulator